MQKEKSKLQFKIAGNLQEILNEGNTPATRIASYLNDLIELKRQSTMDDDNVHHVTQDVALYLFQGTTIAGGVKQHLAMFRALSKMAGANKYRKQLAGFIKWFSYIERSRELELLHLEVDRNLLDLTPKDKQLLQEMILKYNTVLSFD